MASRAEQMRSHLERLVHGLTGLRHDGRFDEPNLDGSAGDYISFDSWEWPQGVGLYGLVRLWQHNGDEALKRTVEDWYLRRLSAGLPPMNINTTAPMLPLALLWSETHDARWEQPLAEWADRLLRDMPRTPEGGFQHNVSDRINDDELWDDTLFMAALFLAAYGQAAKKPACADEAVRQFLVHARYLADPQSGLWFHGWTFDGRHNFARALWARGNAWITVGILDLIEIGGVGAPVRDYLLGVLETQIEALLKLQAPSGAWRTLLDDPNSYEEMSATAGFGYGLMKAARLGIGPKGTAAAGGRALDAVIANIGEDGVLRNVSYGTRMGHDLDHYRNIPIQPTGYGQALAILCLTEGMIRAEAMEKAA
jgi:unsaturated rhamnogalacturonyl hydrolase